MAKTSHEELVKQLEAAKATHTEAKEALKDFRTENEIKKGTDPSEVTGKAGKEYGKLVKAAEKAAEAYEKLKEAEKENRPRKERQSKYEYPADVVTAEDRKKYRTKMRKQSADDAKPGKEKKSDKKASKKEEAPAPVAKPKKKKSSED